MKNTEKGFKVSGNVKNPDSVIDCGNSATMFHLLMGLSTYFGKEFALTGDKSLVSRNHSDFFEAKKLYNGTFVETTLAKESAQLKSFHLISMLNHGGILHFRSKTRRNTEELLLKMGVKLIENENSIEVFPTSFFHGFSTVLRKDPSSAFIAACLSLICEKTFVISGIYPEYSRMKPFVFLQKMGYDVSFYLDKGTFTVEGSNRFSGGGDIGPEILEIPEIIDEIPFLAFMSARAGSCFRIKNAAWLRNKESDRIKESVKRLSIFFKTEEFDDGFSVFGKVENSSEIALPHSLDHRMEMLSFLMAEDNGLDFKMNDSYKVSFPLFYELADFVKNGRQN